MTQPAPGPAAGSGDSALRHLQQAAIEMIEAARSTLDLLEGLLAEPGGIGAVLGHVGDLAQNLAGQDRPPSGQHAARDATPGVQRIPVVRPSEDPDADG